MGCQLLIPVKNCRMEALELEALSTTGARSLDVISAADCRDRADNGGNSGMPA